MGKSKSSTSSQSSKEVDDIQIKIVSRFRVVAADAPSDTATDFETVTTFNMFANMSRDVILRGAPPSIGRIVSSRRLSSSTTSSGSRLSFGGSRSSSSSTTFSFLSSGLPSAEPTYPLLALLEILRHERHLDVLDGLDIFADAGSLAQVLHFQRTALGGDHISHHPSSSSTSIRSSSSSPKDKPARHRAQSSSQGGKPSMTKRELRFHALLHENTLYLLSDLYEALGHLENGSDTTMTEERRIKAACQAVTHSPLHGSDDHKRAIRYTAGGLNFLVHFTAHASTANYQQPFLPVSQSPREFSASSKIDYHAIPEGVELPLDHALLVHTALDGNEAVARDEMIFARLEKLMTVSEGTKGREPKSLGVQHLKTKEGDDDLPHAAALVAPFLRQLRDVMSAHKSPMVLVQQLNSTEVILAEDNEPLQALWDAVQRISSRQMYD
ncbi:hypothetical protein FRC17_007441 [Serendipita sp. 399]|nr:hypothetical protein FRC17_007441 [Serendipita sp. 399]